MILPFQGNSSSPDIRQQAEHLLHEYELDDETLQEAQLEQHKIFQNFPTSPAPGLPQVFLLLLQRAPNQKSLQLTDSSEALFDTKADNTFIDDNDKPLARTHIYEKTLLILLHEEGLLSYWLYSL